MKHIAGFILLIALSACGGGRSDYDSRQKNYYQSSSGPISNACLKSDRKARSPQLCSCIQTAANMTLNSSQQKTAIRFYQDPHQAQVMRQSDKRSDEKFWKAYREYVDYAEAICR